MKKLFGLALLMVSMSTAYAAPQYGARFFCVSKDGLFGSGTERLIAVRHEDKLTITWVSDGVSATGTYDPTYQPNPANSGFVRYIGLEGLSNDSGTIYALVHRSLLAPTSQGGLLKLFWRGESFYKSTYSCRLWK